MAPRGRRRRTPGRTPRDERARWSCPTRASTTLPCPRAVADGGTTCSRGGPVRPHVERLTPRRAHARASCRGPSRAALGLALAPARRAFRSRLADAREAQATRGPRTALARGSVAMAADPAAIAARARRRARRSSAPSPLTAAEGRCLRPTAPPRREAAPPAPRAHCVLDASKAVSALRPRGRGRTPGGRPRSARAPASGEREHAAAPSRQRALPGSRASSRPSSSPRGAQPAKLAQGSDLRRVRGIGTRRRSGARARGGGGAARLVAEGTRWRLPRASTRGLAERAAGAPGGGGASRRRPSRRRHVPECCVRGAAGEGHPLQARPRAARGGAEGDARAPRGGSEPRSAMTRPTRASLRRGRFVGRRRPVGKGRAERTNAGQPKVDAPRANTARFSSPAVC